MLGYVETEDLFHLDAGTGWHLLTVKKYLILTEFKMLQMLG